MITKLGILNFQSISQLAVECGPITVFVGESDSGKSAVVRALYAAAFNDYPTDHVRQGQDHSTVVLATEGGTVQVEKGKAKNAYALNSQGKRQEWDRVGRDVPEAVAEFLGWRVVELDDGTKFVPSIQRQFDGPFLLAESPIKAAKILGSLTNISTLFAAIREGTNEERRARKEAEVAKDEADRHEAMRAELEPALLKEEADFDTALLLFTTLEQQVKVLREVEILETSITTAADVLARARERINSIEVPALPDLDAEIAEVGRVKALEDEIYSSMSAIDAAHRRVEIAEGVRDRHAEELAEKVKTMKVCPICEREMV